MAAVLGSQVFTAGVTFQIMECGNCGTPFAIPMSLYEELKVTQATWYCPNGHARHFTETTESRLRKRLAAAEAARTHERDQREAAERSLRAQKGHATRLRRRIAAGTCPCCRRNFQDLARHMAGQHPDYAAES